MFGVSVGHFMQLEEGLNVATGDDKTTCLNSCLTDLSCEAVAYLRTDALPCKMYSYVGRLVPSDNAEYFRKACPDSTSEDSK